MDPLHKVQIMFGSKSDSHIYEEIASTLHRLDVNYSMDVASAHRTPELVHKILDKDDFNVIIAGAGLAAHLPGVVASKTIKPVIGVPVSSNYQGLDSVLSIMQMPPGIPVMGVGVNNAKVAAINAAKMLKQFSYINIIGDTDNKVVAKARDTIEFFDNPFKVQQELDKEAVNIKFIDLGEKTQDNEALVIYCPLSKDSTAEAALNLLNMSKHGLWVGLNRGENAALAALQIINLDGRHNQKFQEHREQLKK